MDDKNESQQHDSNDHPKIPNTLDTQDLMQNQATINPIRENIYESDKIEEDSDQHSERDQDEHKEPDNRLRLPPIKKTKENDRMIDETLNRLTDDIMGAYNK